MNLNQYLETTFPNLKLQKPLFYNWHNSLRFEIGLESMPTMKEHWHRLVIHTEVSEVNYKRILSRLVYLDFGFAGPEVYFVNKTKNIIFNLYDDRGLDIIASEKKDLKNTYQKFNNWILDYDRKQIDALFK